MLHSKRKYRDDGTDGGLGLPCNDEHIMRRGLTAVEAWRVASVANDLDCDTGSGRRGPPWVRPASRFLPQPCLPHRGLHCPKCQEPPAAFVGGCPSAGVRGLAHSTAVRSLCPREGGGEGGGGGLIREWT